MSSYFKNFFNLKAALGGAIVMSTIVTLINLEHGYNLALFAALKQGLYTFFVAGMVVRLCHWLATRPLPTAFAITLAVIIPSTLTATLVFILHSLKGTPEPVKTTLAVAGLSLISFLILALREVLANKSSN
jgi:hypothetical protein